MNSPSRDPKTILLVEDDLDIRETFAEILADEGYRVASAANGVEALEYLRTSTRLPGLILLDLMMPIMDGIQFWEQQQQVPGWADIPVVVMSANTNLSMKAARVSAVALLRKPLDISELLDTVQAVTREPSQSAPTA